MSSINKPSVSIITPCYNGARYLRETIESALAQTRPPLEMIVIDDGSTDDSAAIAESFGEPVRVIRQKNQGESVARNRGIEVARGSHLMFLDADDLLHPEALERLTDAVAGDPRAVALMGSATFLGDERTTFLSTVTPQVDDFLATVVSRNPGLIHAYLTPTDLVKQVGGFSDSLVYFEDWDFWCQVALTGAPLVPVDFVGALYRRHSNAQTPSAKKVDRKLGHVRVIQRLLEGLLDSDDLTERYGQQAFWSSWAALRSARDLGIRWGELKPLTMLVQQLLQRGPTELRTSRFGRTARLLGLRNAMRLQRSEDKASPGSDAELLARLQSVQDQEVTSPTDDS